MFVLWKRCWRGRLAEEPSIRYVLEGTLQVKLTESKYVRTWRGSTDNLEAWDLYLRATGAIRRFTKEDGAEARRLARKAVALDPEFVGGWSAII